MRHWFYQAISGRDLLDETTLASPDLDEVLDLRLDISDLNIAFCESVFFNDVDLEVEAAVRNTKGVLESLGVTIGRLEIPEVDEAEAIPGRYLDMAVEAYSANKDLLDEHAKNIDFILELDDTRQECFSTRLFFHDSETIKTKK